MRRPSGENVAVTTPPLWPESMASGMAVAASQIRAVRSPEEVTMRRPSGEKPAPDDGTVMAGEDGKPGVGRAHFLKHVDRRRRPRRRGVSGSRGLRR